MAQLSQTAQEFLQNTFGPMVAVLCSHDAEFIALKNNLSFVELARPFCRLSTEAHIRDPTGQLHAVRNLRIILTDGNSQPPPVHTVRKKLSDAVAGSQATTKEGETDNVIAVGSYDLQLSLLTPWYESYRETYLSEIAPSDHEFLKHHVACMLVVSTAHADPMDQFSKLSQEQHQLQHNVNNQFPKWLCPNIFKYYVLLHDNTEGEEEKADAVYQSMKSTFGMHACHLLRINSKSQEAADASSVSNGDANLPNPWVQYISPTLEKEVPCSEIGSTTNLGSFPDRVKEEAELSNGGHSGEDSSSLDMDDGPNDPSPEDVVMVEVESPNSEIISHPLAQNFNSSSREKSHSSTEELDQDSDILNQEDEEVTKSKKIPGVCFTLSDHDRMRIFIHEFVVRGLLPYMEKMIRNLSELQQNRRGLHRSFVSATKKWFGGRQDKIPVTPLAPDMPKYLREAPELQMRRLADLAFLVQMYDLAYTSYHIAKRDFSNDQAWMHLAGALEMAAISSFMHGNLQKTYPQHYMEHASHYYADICKKINFASRNVMLYAEILKTKKMYNEAAMDFIKMTGEDSDLRSALFLEQASLCFIALPKPKVRKYAFHMILAGHRFSKASQRRHALRCYCQALQVYKGKGWHLAEDHINFTIGRQCLNLRQLENATSALRHLLTQESHQPAAQQGSFLREYLFVFKQLTEQKKKEGQERTSLPQLPLPIINKSAIRVLLTNPKRPQFSDKTAATSVTFECILNRTEMKEWQRLEELTLLFNNFKKIPAGFKPFVHLFHAETDNSVHPLAVLTEPITVQILMENPLKIPLVLSQLHLLWRFIPVDFEVTNKENPEQKPVAITNETTEEKERDLQGIIETEYLEELSLLCKEYKIIYLKLTPKQTGELHITGLGYGLSSQPNINTGNDIDSGINDHKRPLTFSSSIVTIPGMQELDIQGPRLNNTTAERCSVTYGPDRRLDPIIVPHMPNLEVLFQDFPSTLLSGEVCLVTVEFINDGHCSLINLQVASDRPEFFTFGFNRFPPESDPSQSSVSNQLSGPQIYMNMQAGSTQRQTEENYLAMCNVSHVLELPLEGGVLGPGCRLPLPMWVRGPETSGVHEIKMLFMYQSEEENVKMRHRTLHHTIVINTASSLSLSASAHRGQCSAHSQNSGDLQLSVHLAIENMNQLHDSNIAEFSISQVSCVSPRWSLFPAVDITEEMKVLGGESLRVNFRARQHSHYSQGEVSNKLLAFSNCCFGKNIVDSTSTPCVDFCFRTFPGSLPSATNPLMMMSGTSTSTPTISPSPSSHELSLLAIEEKARLKEDLECSQTADMLLVVLWKAFVVDDAGESHALVGQSHISLDILNQEETTHPLHKKPNEIKQLKFTKEPEPVDKDIPKSEVLTQLLHYNLQFEPVIEHDFSTSVLCRVPIQLQISNCCQCELEVFIETNPADNRLSQPAADYSAIFLPPDSSSFAWCSLSAEIITIAPSQQAAATLHACFGAPGVYNLNSIQLYVKNLLSSSQKNSTTEHKSSEFDISGQRSNLVKQNSLPTSMITVVERKSSKT